MREARGQSSFLGDGDIYFRLVLAGQSAAAAARQGNTECCLCQQKALIPASSQ